MLRQLQEENLFTKSDVLNYIGSRFRVKLGLPEWYTDSECAQYLFKYCLLAHLNTETEKFNLLVYAWSPLRLPLKYSMAFFLV